MASEILLFGGSGKLGRAILDLRPETRAPGHKECDITDAVQVSETVRKHHPSIVINSAALVGTRECENNHELAWQTNVEGAANVARACRENNIRHIFVSSAAIFNGQKGNYAETDVPTPTFYYAVSKVVAEQAVRMLPDYAIARLDFFSTESLKYAKVLVDHFTSKIPVTEAARKILQVAVSGFIGIVNLGQSRKSLYDILKPYYPDIEPIKIADSALPGFPRDISLNLKLWQEQFGDN